MPDRASMWLDVRKLAALDMALHGARFIVIEFAAGVVGCAAIGVLSLAAGLRLRDQGITWQLLLGLALIFISLNYVPLLIHAIDLARRGTARTEVADDLSEPRVVRRFGVLQLWILIPMAVVVMALAQRFSRRP